MASLEREVFEALMLVKVLIFLLFFELWLFLASHRFLLAAEIRSRCAGREEKAIQLHWYDYSFRIY